jgi:hypothetical protein
MRRDPIVDEVRKHREAIAREYGDDLEAMVAAFQEEDLASGAPTVSFPPKRAPKSPKRQSNKSRRPNQRMEPTRSGSRKRAAHS